jgi:hypothetical protein
MCTTVRSGNRRERTTGGAGAGVEASTSAAKTAAGLGFFACQFERFRAIYLSARFSKTSSGNDEIAIQFDALASRDEFAGQSFLFH